MDGFIYLVGHIPKLIRLRANRPHQAHSRQKEDAANDGYTPGVLPKSQSFIEDGHNAYNHVLFNSRSLTSSAPQSITILTIFAGELRFEKRAL